MRLATLLPPLALAACAQTPAEIAQSQRAATVTQEKLARELAGLRPAEKTACLQAYPITHTKAYGATLLYEVSGSLKYRNDTAGGCESIARGDYLVTRSFQGRTCQGDIGQTFEPGSHVPTGSCALGEFVAYRK